MKRIFIIIFTLMLAVTAFVIPLGAVSALEPPGGAVRPTSSNWFSMEQFKEENLVFLSDLEYVNSNEYVVEFKYKVLENKVGYISSGSFYLEKGTYTLSAIYQSTCTEQTQVDLNARDGNGQVVGSGLYFTSSKYSKKTFNIDISGFYYLKVNHVLTPLDNYTHISFSNIMINEGDEALPFVPYNYQPPDMNNTEHANYILDGLNDLFKMDSGIIASVSLGTFILLCFIVLKLFRRR